VLLTASCPPTGSRGTTSGRLVLSTAGDIQGPSTSAAAVVPATVNHSYVTPASPHNIKKKYEQIA